VLSLSQKLVQAGATALTIHGRSGEKKFGLPIDLQVIKDVAASLSVPVVANGGIFTGADAKNVIEQTKATAVMPGRGLIGNPWLIEEILRTLSGSSFVSPSLQEKKDVCLDHLKILCDFYGERTGVMRMRKILPEYFSSCFYLKDLKRDSHQIAYMRDIPVLLERIQQVGASQVYDNRNS
jgi:tRNA-dihydrouridine synthase B